MVLALQRSAGNQAVARGLIQRFTASTASAEAHTEARGRHADDRAALRQTVEAAATSADERLRNAAQWVLQGRVLLYALTPTGDSDARAATVKKPDHRAYFGYPDRDPFHTKPVAGHVRDDTVADYDAGDMEANDRVVFNPRHSGGFRIPLGGKIFVVEPARIDAINQLRGAAGALAPVTETLKHETQHESDVLYNLELGEALEKEKRAETEEAVAAIEADKALAEYKTEYRAYLAQGAAWLQDPVDPTRAATLGVAGLDPLQFQILNQIVGGYAKVREAWNANATLSDGRAFRSAVLAVRGRIEDVSANPYNSPRVMDFYDFLFKAQGSNKPDGDATARLVETLRGLAGRDTEVIREGALYKRTPLHPWLQATTDRLLADPRADVSDVLAGEARAQADAQRQEERMTPPSTELIVAAFASWDQVRAALKGVMTREQGSEHAPEPSEPALENQDVKDELETWSKVDSEFKKHFPECVGNLRGRLDWWTVLDARTA